MVHHPVCMAPYLQHQCYASYEGVLGRLVTPILDLHIPADPISLTCCLASPCSAHACCSGTHPVLHDILLCFEVGFKKCPFLPSDSSKPLCCIFCRLSSSSLDTSQEVLETTFSFMPCLKPPLHEKTNRFLHASILRKKSKLCRRGDCVATWVTKIVGI